MKTIQLILVLIFCTVIVCSAQIYYSDIDPSEYSKWATGNQFYIAQITLVDSSVHDGYVSRLNDSNIVRFKESTDNDARIYTLTEKEVLSFTYMVKKWQYPKFVYKDIDNSRRHNKPLIRTLEIISSGDINVYTHKWVDLPDEVRLPFSKKTFYTVNVQFYLEKDGVLYIVDDFSQDIKYLINDKEKVFMEYKDNYKKKYRDTTDFRPFLCLIDLYNKTEYE